MSVFLFHSAFLYHLQSCITIPHPHLWEVQTNDSGCQSAGLPAAPSARSDKSYRLSGTSPPQLCTIMHQCTPMHCIISMHCNTKDYSALYSSHFILFALYCTSFHITIYTKSIWAALYIVRWNQNADISLVCTVVHAHLVGLALWIDLFCICISVFVFLYLYFVLVYLWCLLCSVVHAD